MASTLESRPVLAGKRRSEGVARRVAWLGAAALLAALALMLVRLLQASWPLFQAQGVGWVFGTTWAPSNQQFGALPFIYGTLVTAVIGLVIAAPIGLGTALFISERAPARIQRPLGGLIDLLAAVPSVIYGLWGLFVLVPILKPVERWLSVHASFIPIFKGESGAGFSFFVAGVVLAIMILPTVSAVCREVFLTVPSDVREAAYALGSTRWEAIRLAVLPPARSGIIGALILGLGRALGETIAVTMVIGNTAVITKYILGPGYSMASVIAQEFGESLEPLHRQALIAIGLVLFVITVVIDIGARFLVRRTAKVL